MRNVSCRIVRISGITTFPCLRILQKRKRMIVFRRWRAHRFSCFKKHHLFGYHTFFLNLVFLLLSFTLWIKSSLKMNLPYFVYSNYETSDMQEMHPFDIWHGSYFKLTKMLILCSCYLILMYVSLYLSLNLWRSLLTLDSVGRKATVRARRKRRRRGRARLARQMTCQHKSAT